MGLKQLPFYRAAKMVGRAMEKTKQSGGKEVCFYTIPTGFKNND